MDIDSPQNFAMIPFFSAKPPMDQKNPAWCSRGISRFIIAGLFPESNADFQAD